MNLLTNDEKKDPEMKHLHFDLEFIKKLRKEEEILKKKGCYRSFIVTYREKG